MVNRREDIRIHEPHDSCGSIGKVGHRNLPGSPSANLPDCRGNQQKIPHRTPRKISERLREAEQNVDYPQRKNLHGMARNPRRLQRKRRCGTPHKASERSRAERLVHALPEKIQQQDERNHAATLALLFKPEARGIHHEQNRSRLGERPHKTQGA